MMIPPRYSVVKTYPPRGSIQQFRLAEVCAFICFRCGREKKSRLVTTFGGDWNRLLCNACCGTLLSIHEVHKGTLDDDARAANLTQVLLSLVPAAESQRLADVLVLRDGRTKVLTPKTLRLLASAEFVATKLATTTNLDWSAAVIGLCKAFEAEVSERLHEPLRRTCSTADMSSDCRDKDFGRVARYVAGKVETAPELGATRHFLETASHSLSRRHTSPLLQGLYELSRQWPKADWLYVAAPAQFESLTSRFRNRAAHTDELGPQDFRACEEYVVGRHGLMWQLILATAKS